MVYNGQTQNQMILLWQFLFFSEATVFASGDALHCGAMCGDVVAFAGARSQAQSHDCGTVARRAKTSTEGFLRFLLYPKLKFTNEQKMECSENNRGGKLFIIK